MREIKFRAWDDNKLTLTNYQIVDGMLHFMDKYTGVWIRDDEQKRFKLMQYTGLKDTNGKEVYEGDIVRMHFFFENYHPVTLGAFEDEEEIVCKLSITPLGVYFENNNMTGYLCDYLGDPSEELEVIGNIYENPELIGERHED